jgi:hypothetical protein
VDLYITLHPTGSDHRRADQRHNSEGVMYGRESGPFHRQVEVVFIAA